MQLIVKALLSTALINVTLGLLLLVFVWGMLSLLHAAQSVIMTGEVIAAIVVVALGLPLFRQALKNERMAAGPLPEGIAPDSVAQDH